MHDFFTKNRPSEAFEKSDADRAIEIAPEVIGVIERKLLDGGDNGDEM